MDCRGWICAANHDEHVLDHAVVPLWYYFLGMGEEAQNLDKEQSGAPYVKWEGMGQDMELSRPVSWMHAYFGNLVVHKWVYVVYKKIEVPVVPVSHCN